MRDFHRPGRSPVIATNAICATSHPLAAQTALKILQDGGNAVDAAIAGAILLGIAEPQSCGIGGDCFVLMKPAGGERVIALNGSGRAPAGLDADRIRRDGFTSIGTESVHSVTIPGAVDAFCRLSADWGRLGLAASLAPAIQYAEEGVPVAQRVALDWRESAGRLSGIAARYYLKDGEPLKEGDIYRSHEQADVLRRIAERGRSAFYEGEVAEDMVSALRSLGGSHTLDDFASTSCTYTDPISGTYKGHELLEHPPNGQGATAIMMLNVLSHFNLTDLDPHGARRAHLEAEAAKLAYDVRDRFIADPDHMTRLDQMLSSETARKLAAMIDPDHALTVTSGMTGAPHRDTVYLTVVDRDRMAVSLIYSTYWSFGSGIASPRFGILFQNRGSGFTLQKGHPNEAGPDKRPLHTIIPAMLKRNGRVIMPFGVMGGAYQPTGHTRLITNMLDYGMGPQEAVDAPRCFATDGILKLERGYTDSVRIELTAMGHRTTTPDTPLGGGQAIVIDDERGVLTGASDPRKDGCALGY